MELKKATRKKVKLRLNLSAPSGAGKTMSALLMAKGLVGDWDKIAVIDTENGSASLYEHLGPFNVIDLHPPFSPDRYIQAINSCVSAGMECIIIDSSTHEWNGPGGCLEINEKLAQARYKGNTWSAWNETTPKHDAFVQTVLQCPVHVIACTRSKMDTIMTDDRKVKKIGLKDIQRDGWEYELTVSLSIDRDTHMAIASKDRTELFEGKSPFIISEETGLLIKNWCEKGVEPEKKNILTPEEQDYFEYELWMQQNLQKLLDGSGYEGDSYSKIKASIDNDAAMNMRLYEKIKVNLEANQRDRITSGDNYNQSDISKHMAKM